MVCVRCIYRESCAFYFCKILIIFQTRGKVFISKLGYCVQLRFLGVERY